VLRPALLWAAKSGWLQRHVVRSPAGRRAAARFMPGEETAKLCGDTWAGAD